MSGEETCKCSILSAREEKLLDDVGDEGQVQYRLICNRCGTVLDSEIVPAGRVREPALRQRHDQNDLEEETA